VPPAQLIPAPCWKVSYIHGPPGWLAYLIDSHLFGRLEALWPALPETISLGTANTLSRQIGLRPPMSMKQLQTALDQNIGLLITSSLEAVNAKGRVVGTKDTWLRRYDRWHPSLSLFVPCLSDPNEPIVLQVIDGYRECFGRIDPRPVHLEFRQALPSATRSLYEWLSYRLYAAALQGSPIATIGYGDYCRYASLPRQLSPSEMKRQVETLHEPLFQSGYVAEVSYEARVYADELPDWKLLYRVGPGARNQFVRFHEWGIQALVEEADSAPDVLVSGNPAD